MRYISHLALLPITFLALACANRDQARFDQVASQTIQGFRPVAYHRSGDLTGADDRIAIAADGTIQTSGRALGNHSGRLSDFQMMQLVRLFEGWENLQASYPAAAGTKSKTTFATEISWGDKTVTVTDGAPGINEQFLRIRERLESFAQGLPAAQSRPAM